MSMPETLERLEADIEEGLFTRGVQICISSGGARLLDTALGEDGMGRPAGIDTLFRVYCTIKPVAAMAVGHMVEAGALDLDAPLSDLLPSVEALQGGVTTRHVLNHTAGLHKPAAVTIELVPPEDRPAFLDRQHRPPGWHVGRDAGYSELFGWNLVGRLLEQLSGEPLRDHLRRVVLDPLGMHDTFIGMDDDDVQANLGRVGVNVDLRGWRGYPMLFERTERVLRETNPAHGGYTTARDLETLYRSLLEVLGGTLVPGLPSAEVVAMCTRSARPPAFDVVLDRECDYGLGFMTDLAGHHFGRQCSPGSFGHSGNVGSSFAYADPVHDLAVAVVFNGIVDPDSAFLRRPSLVRAIHRDLGLGGEAGASSETAEAAEAPARRGLLRRRRQG